MSGGKGPKGGFHSRRTRAWRSTSSKRASRWSGRSDSSPGTQARTKCQREAKLPSSRQYANPLSPPRSSLDLDRRKEQAPVRSLWHSSSVNARESPVYIVRTKRRQPIGPETTRPEPFPVEDQRPDC